MGARIEDKKQNNLKLSIFNQCDGLDSDVLLIEIENWMKQLKKIMEIGGEGGSVCFYKSKKAGKDVFWFQTDEGTILDFSDEFEEDDLVFNSQSSYSFESLLNIAINKYQGLFYQIPILIDSEILNDVQCLFNKHLDSVNEEDDFNREKWEELLSAKNPNSKVSVSNSELKKNNRITTTWSGYCPECTMNGERRGMALNSDDFYECDICNLQIAISFPGVQGVILKFRGKGEFNSIPKFANEITNGELLSPQEGTNPPFLSKRVFQSSDEISDYITSVD